MRGVDGDAVVRLIVKNGTVSPIRLFLWPWGEAHELGVGDVYEVSARGTAAGLLTAEQVEGGVAVSGWPGCTMSVAPLRRFTVPTLDSEGDATGGSAG